MRKILTIAYLVVVLLTANIAYGAISGGTGGGIGSPNYWKLVGTTLTPLNALWSVVVSVGNLFGGNVGDTATTTTIASGDIIVRGSTSTWTNFPVGTDDYVLSSSSTAPLKLAWVAQSSGGSSTTTINGASGPAFTFTASSTGSDFTISTSTGEILFNLPSATSTVRGLLTSNDWINFNGKVNTSTTLTAGAGLTGGGDLSANRTFTVGQGTGITVNADDVALTVPVTVANGGTGTTTLTSNNVMLGGSSIGFVAPGTSGNVLTSNGTTWSSTVPAVTRAGNIKTIQFIIENPTASEDDLLFVFNATSTITKVQAVNKATAGNTVTFNLHYGSSAQTATTTSPVLTSYQAVTSTTTPSSWTSFASSTPNTGDVLRFVTNSASSTQFIMTMSYYEN